MQKPPTTPVYLPSVSPLNEAAFCAWFGAAAAGDRIEYWRGHLAVDVNATESLLAHDDRRQLGRVAGRAYRLAEDGKAHLVQRRHGDGDYSYLLVVRPRRRPIRARFVTSILNAVPSPNTGALSACPSHILEVA